MAKKKKTAEVTITPQQRHQELNACINCIHEDKCDNPLPFPINLEDCCDDYKKKEFKEKII